jgi:hypothetical protein
MLKYWWEGVLYDLGLYRGPAPTPHAIKRRIIREYAEKFGAKYFVETGTFMGDMTSAMTPLFERLYTIELSDFFFQKAVARFAPHPKVRPIHGDSAKELERLVPECDRCTLFWLDAHWSGGTTARGDLDSPVSDELGAIFRSNEANHVILIDDARDFRGENGYPTVDQIRARVAVWRPDYDVTVDRDIIRIVPPAGQS